MTIQGSLVKYLRAMKVMSEVNEEVYSSQNI